jgi:hypothetical protein
VFHKRKATFWANLERYRRRETAVVRWTQGFDVSLIRFVSSSRKAIEVAK